MGQLGRIGYGVYNWKGKLLILHPNGAELLEERPYFEALYDDIIDKSEEEDVYEDHSINKGGEL